MSPTSKKGPGTQYLLNKYLTHQCTFLFQIGSSGPRSKPHSWQISANSQLRQPHCFYIRMECVMGHKIASVSRGLYIYFANISPYKNMGPNYKILERQQLEVWLKLERGSSFPLSSAKFCNASNIFMLILRNCLPH